LVLGKAAVYSVWVEGDGVIRLLVLALRGFNYLNKI